MEKVTIHLVNDKEFGLADGRTLDQLNPKELMLAAWGMCSGRTAMGILDRMRVEIKELEIECSGVISTEELRPESTFTHFNISYNVECARLEDQPKVSRAVNLTQNRYCGMGMMLRKIASMTHGVYIHSTEPEFA